MTNPNPPGPVTCPHCGVNVPDVDFCLSCGVRIKGDVVIPPLKDRERQILEELLSLGGARTVSDIHENVEGSKEYTRRCLMDLTRYGLVERPSRGRYTVSKLGESALEIQKIIKIEKPTKRSATILIETPPILRAGTMIKIFKRAGGARMGKNGFVTLASVLERVGDEIAHEAITIAGDNNRKTVKAEDMDQAIGTVLFKVSKEAKG